MVTSIAMVFTLIQTLFVFTDALVMKKLFSDGIPSTAGYRFVGYTRDITTFRNQTNSPVWIVNHLRVVGKYQDSNFSLAPEDIVASEGSSYDDPSWKSSDEANQNPNATSFLGFQKDNVTCLELQLNQGQYDNGEEGNYMSALKIQAKNALSKDGWIDAFEVKGLTSGENNIPLLMAYYGPMCNGDLEKWRDGECDASLRNAPCAWDGGDCAPEYLPNCFVSNNSKIGDGICDSGEYHSSACGWDGGDCITPSPNDKDSGSGNNAGTFGGALFVAFFVILSIKKKQNHYQGGAQRQPDFPFPPSAPGLPTDQANNVNVDGPMTLERKLDIQKRREFILTNIVFEVSVDVYKES